jgi:hypothetical protein
MDDILIATPTGDLLQQVSRQVSHEIKARGLIIAPEKNPRKLTMEIFGRYFNCTTSVTPKVISTNNSYIHPEFSPKAIR